MYDIWRDFFCFELERKFVKIQLHNDESKKKNYGSLPTMSVFYRLKKAIINPFTAPTPRKKAFSTSCKNYHSNKTHKHYFAKADVKKDKKNAKCKVCGLALIDFELQRKIEKFTPNLKNRTKRHLKYLGSKYFKPNIESQSESSMNI